MGPLRKRFYVNGEPVAGSTLHAEYLKPAAKLLEAVKQRMQLGNLQQLAQRYITESGAVLTALSRFGQDEIRIDVPYRQGGVVTSQEVTTVETPEFVRVLRVVGYTIWLVDETSTGLVEYDTAGQLTGRVFPNLIDGSAFDWITDVIYAHDALWASYATGAGASGIFRINDRSGEIANVGYADTSALAVALTAYSGGVVAVHDNYAGNQTTVVKMNTTGEIVAQGSGEYSTNMTAIFSDDENVYLTGGGGMLAGIGWQSGGTYLRTLSLETLAGTTQSFVDANHPTASGYVASWDSGGTQLLMTGADEMEGTYHDWAASGGTLAPIAGYGFDHLTANNPWLTCGNTLFKFHYSGDVEVQRGNAQPVTLDPYYALLPAWDGDAAIWAVHYTSDAQTQTLARIGFNGSVTSYPLPPTSFAYLTPAIQLTKVEVEIPASEATEYLPDDLAARELRIIRSRSGYT